ncbi:hypothetical protein VOI54_13770 [Tamlana sp. 2201CG12-4]|uniref:hypothetical protein n=1 Tax=Tamlana sp. 2201CG12-4 TaxID=3112582 RepID=UPI002DB71F66|nr:hypothetical protein [Tamlana sp. 2201CG12-4]MEC3908095.1 hypothetical protein [Tamlana sp. 2201CG12-4]
MKIIKYLLKPFFLLLLFNSCGSMKTFEELNIDKEHVFVDDGIVIKTKKGRCSKISITSDNPDIRVLKKSNCYYYVSSLKESTGEISITFNRKKNNSISKTSVVNFYEHGTKDFATVEGLKIDYDTTEKALTLLGSPEWIYKNKKTKKESWFYYSKGLAIYTENDSKTIGAIRAYCTSWNIDNVKDSNGKAYPYQIYNIGDFSSENEIFNMNNVINSLGEPNIKRMFNPKNSTISYDYIGFNNDKTTNFSFFFKSTDVSDYKGKQIEMINFY